MGIKILNGHTTPETAYIAEDYPYGFKLRCKMRIWIETAEKGKGKGEQRYCTQTTNPKKGNIWNKPKYGIYHSIVVMFINEENGHVEHDCLHFSSFPEYIMEFKHKYFEQLDEPNKKRFDLLEKMSRKLNPNSWAEYERKQIEKDPMNWGEAYRGYV